VRDGGRVCTVVQCAVLLRRGTPTVMLAWVIVILHLLTKRVVRKT